MPRRAPRYRAERLALQVILRHWDKDSNRGMVASFLEARRREPLTVPMTVGMLLRPAKTNRDRRSLPFLPVVTPELVAQS